MSEQQEFRERIRAALSSTEEVPDTGEFEPVLYDDVVVGRAPPWFQAVVKLGDVYREKAEEATTEEDGEFLNNVGELCSVLALVTYQLDNNLSPSGLMAVREDWQLVRPRLDRE